MLYDSFRYILRKGKVGLGHLSKDHLTDFHSDWTTFFIKSCEHALLTSTQMTTQNITKIPEVSTSLSHLLFPSKDNIWVVELYTYVWIFYKWNTQGMLDIFCVWYQLLNIGQLILHEHIVCMESSQCIYSIKDGHWAAPTLWFSLPTAAWTFSSSFGEYTCVLFKCMLELTAMGCRSNNARVDSCGYTVRWFSFLISSGMQRISLTLTHTKQLNTVINKIHCCLVHISICIDRHMYS